MGWSFRVRADFRRTILFGSAALATLIAGIEFGALRPALLQWQLSTYGCALATAGFGLAATRTAAREVYRVCLARAGDVAATPLRLMVLLGGYLIAFVAVCDLIGLDLRQLLVGGAITGIVLGLAAQPILGNLFAGIVLLFARPYLPGQKIRVLSGSINGPLVGVVISAGLLYTALATDEGPISIPNSSLLAAAVGPVPAETSPPIER